jgi:phage terminase large subunit-like protein
VTLRPFSARAGLTVAQTAMARHLDRLLPEPPPTFDAAPLALRAEPLYHQLPPDSPLRPESDRLEDWRTWIIRSGRGAGKTEGAARYWLQELRANPRARLGFGAPTQADVRGTMFEGPSGIITLAPNEFHYNRSTIEAWHIGGGYLHGMGAEKPARWNGGNWSGLWWDELALCRQESFLDSRLALRLPPRPRLTVTTTPKRTKWVHDLEERPGSFVARTEDGRIPNYHDNPHLAAAMVEELEREYAGTDLGRQELLGEWLEEAQGALWKRAWINDFRVDPEDVPDLRRLVIAVDPSGSGSPTADECGIILCGLGVNGHGYVLADVSMRASPDEWATVVADLYDDEMVDLVVAERNYGGEMVEKTLRVAHPTLSYKYAVATRGKEVRAQPVALLQQQGRIHHVGASLAKLEDELVTWVPGPGVKSPNRLDALVWLMTEIMGISSKYGGFLGHAQKELEAMRRARA